MPRFFSIGIVVVLVLGAIGGGAFLWLQRGDSEPSGQTDSTAETGDSEFGLLQPAQTGSQRQVASNDDDEDGLLNSDEAIWGSDPNNADTDGDGFLDGEEIAAGHDPTKPAPNDKLALGGDAVSANQAPENITALNSEQYFTDNVDLSGGDKNLTEIYQSEYGTTVQSPATMLEFAVGRPVETNLPRPEGGRIPAAVEDSGALIGQYLDVADNDSALADATQYAQAQYDIQERGDTSTMSGLANTVRIYQASISATPVPGAALELHKVLIAYTDLLAATFDQIAGWDEDPAKSLVATRQLEEIDTKYYPVIHREIRRLRAVQGSAG